MSRHEADELGKMLERMFRALVRRAGEGDDQAVEVLARLEGVASAAVAAGGAAAHETGGYSWTQIGDYLGVSRQAARQRCTGKFPVQGGGVAGYTGPPAP